MLYRRELAIDLILAVSKHSEPVPFNFKLPIGIIKRFRD
jgi:hypothetical protein